MGMSVAAIFDSAGTLVSTCRVVKELETGHLSHGVSSVQLTASVKGVLIAIMEDPDIFMKAPPQKPLRVFLKPLRLKVICPAREVENEEVLRWIYKDEEAKVGDLQEVVEALTSTFKPTFPVGTGLIVAKPWRKISATLATGSSLSPKAKRVIDTLKASGVDVYVATGDTKFYAGFVCRALGLDEERVRYSADPKAKMELVKALKERYSRVVYVGDDLNDLLAMREADLSVFKAPSSGPSPKKLEEAADVVIRDIAQILDVIKPSPSVGFGKS